MSKNTERTFNIYGDPEDRQHKMRMMAFDGEAQEPYYAYKFMGTFFIRPEFDWSWCDDVKGSRLLVIGDQSYTAGDVMSGEANKYVETLEH